MFEFKDKEGVFYDMLKKVNSEKLRNSYFINFCFVQVRRLSEKLGASVAAKQDRSFFIGSASSLSSEMY